MGLLPYGINTSAQPTVIGLIKDAYSETPKAHEWLEIGDAHYRTICRHWTEIKENIVPASEVNCQWCLNRQRHRAENSTEN